ncbi:MAG: cytochrome b/b6 domain-containing protein [Acidiphilium sp.]|nr:cytochrome b/b6 domain-containing protein [Acidiphilium sp.]MDD4934848.1 cytochrome b/b6 domain-containing protein [Acidiphilium sp.]
MDLRYRTSAQILHWLIALVVIGLLIVGLILKYDLASKAVEPTLAMLHMSFGLCILILMILRLGLRLTWTAPPLPDSISPAIRFASGATQALFYILLIAMPVFGVLFVEAHGKKVPFFGLFTLPTVVGKSDAVRHLFAFLHFWGGITVIALLFLHVAGAIRHQMRGERIIRRMMPRRSN